MPYRKPGKVTEDAPLIRALKLPVDTEWERLCKIATVDLRDRLRGELPKDLYASVEWSPRQVSEVRDQHESMVRVWVVRDGHPICGGAALAVMTNEMMHTLKHDPRELAGYVIQQLRSALRTAFYEAKKGIPA